MNAPVEYSSDSLPIRAGAVPRPNFAATLTLLIGLVITWLTAEAETPSALMRWIAVGTGVSLFLCAYLEVRSGGWQALMRADLIAMGALYYLLFVEFLFPQVAFDEAVQRTEIIGTGILCCFCGFAGIAIGRHLVRRNVAPWRFTERDAPSGMFLILFWLSVGIGYFHMLLAVDFNPFEMVRYFVLPRFDAPWQRGQYGDSKALLAEVGAMLYLVPPLAGVILGRRGTYSVQSRFIVLLVLLFTFFYGFCTGTRNIIGAYLLSFIVAYFYATGASWEKTVIPGLLALIVMTISTYYSPSFRNVGIAQYIKGVRMDEEQTPEKFFVDYNFYVIAVLTNIFPDSFDFVKWKTPIWFLVRPIPRALWPTKPTGEDISPQTYLLSTETGQGGVTISATFVGEAYMAFGLIGVLACSLALGVLCQWWARKASSITSDFGILLYGSGFYAIAISMRSIYWLPVAILPTVAAALIGMWLIRYTPRTALQHPVSMAS